MSMFSRLPEYLGVTNYKPVPLARLIAVIVLAVAAGLLSRLLGVPDEFSAFVLAIVVLIGLFVFAQLRTRRTPDA